MAYERNNENREVTFKIVENVGVMATYENAWSKEVNIVEWNGGNAKFDIRDWDPTHERMRKGITLRRDEALELAKILSKYFELDAAGTSDSDELLTPKETSKKSDAA